MKNFALIANAVKDNSEECAKHIIEILEANGCNCTACLFSPENNAPDAEYLFTNPEMIPAETEAVLSLGGDGTFIHASKDLIGLHLPVFGINFGTLGYLTEVDVNGFKEAIKSIVNGDFRIEERMLLRCDIIVDGEIKKRGLALNDIVVTRSLDTSIAELDLVVDGHYLNHYSADGIILATPTGSTGYNLSAGGPVVLPTAGIVLATPICAHTLNSRTVVFPADVTIEVSVRSGNREKIQQSYVIVDGEKAILLEEGAVVRASKASSVAKIIKINRSSFIEKLGRKMR